jgi:hypothetical protein
MPDRLPLLVDDAAEAKVAEAKPVTARRAQADFI